MTNHSKASHSHFLNLPAEIRTEVYSLFYEPLVQHRKHKAHFICEDARHSLDASVFVSSVPDLQNRSRKISQVEFKGFFQLLLVCRLIHYETSAIWYNNVTFYVRRPIEFANNFLSCIGSYKLSQIRHLEMRLEGIPVGVDGWSCSAPKLSYWSHHQIRTLLRNYLELQSLDTLVIKFEKFADRRLARCSGLRPTSRVSQLCMIESVWSQNKDTNILKSEVRHLNLGEGWRNFNLAYTVIDDDQLDEKDRRCVKTVDGRYRCEIDMKRIFQIALWKDTDFEAKGFCL